MKFVDLRRELVESGAQRSGQVVGLGKQGVPLWPEDAQIELAVEERDFQPVRRGGVAMRVGDPVDETFEAEPAEVVGHLSRAVRAPEEGLDVRP